jgi:alpha-D-xyloside xylohydrolase
VLVKTRELSAEVLLDKGTVIFRDKAGQVLSQEVENGRSFTPVQLEGKSFYAIRQQFSSTSDEAFYGLGQHQNRQVNYKNEDVELAQHNMDVAIPFVMSSRHYGILWDNESISRFGDPREWQQLSQSLKLYDADGKEGGLTATYSVDGKVKLKQVERDVNYQYIKQLKTFPADLAKAKEQRVVWEGKIESATGGVHKLSLYASDYNKLFIDNEPIIDAWRQNWNPWYRNFTLELQPGVPRAIRIEWDRTSGYLALLHRDPLPATEQKNLSLYSEVGQAIDYYFIQGDTADEVISGYRTVTGKAAILPRWAYGFWQSRERYKTQAELLGVVVEYRKRKIPLDNIVMDWFYWKEDSWGSHKFDPARFPDPASMVKQIHWNNAHLMISVWPKFYPTTDHFKELDAKGFIYHRNLDQGIKDWVGPGYLSSFYDPYSAEARKIYWKQINENLNKLDIDAWWLDASEPDPQSNVDMQERKLLMGPTAAGPAAELFNSYPLIHAKGVYEGDRAADPDKRVFILTRSGFPGLQRYAAATWSGDVASRWSDLGDQIAAGINFSLSGLPNWTTDIGGFSLETRYEKPNAKDLEEWRELNTRWFQFGAFCPLFRSHGQFPLREIYNVAPQGTEIYDTLVAYDKLRYRLMPYIYTLGANTYHNDYTIMRGLIMDFAKDPRVRHIGDQYMFGSAFLINPVYEYKARSRTVYLPDGSSWYDFYTGEKTEGGRTVSADAPLSRMPIYVREGSIVPVGPDIQFTGQDPRGPITIQVYTGHDGQFTLYEDGGVSYDYEHGAFTSIQFGYDSKNGELTIGAQQGQFPGAIEKRTFNVRWIKEGQAGADFAANPDETLEYTGAEVILKQK